MVGVSNTLGMAQPTETTEHQRSIPTDQFRYRVLLARLHAGGLTTREAAARCGVTYASWSNWERGMKPRDLLDVVEKISEGLEVDRDWLLWGGPLAPEQRGERPQTARNRLQTVDNVTSAEGRPGAVSGRCRRGDRPAKSAHRPRERVVNARPRQGRRGDPSARRPAVLVRTDT